MTLMACGGGDPGADNPTATTGAGGTDGICLMNNCSEDEHCTGCADGRNTCMVEENRCVACDPNTGQGCPEGEYCTSFGLCAPDGTTCPTDPQGKPTITCQANADCKACSPMNQVCDTQTGKCQACTATNTQHCLSSDICVDTDNDKRPETCSPKCPKNCTVDNQCAQCGPPGNPAHACFAHKCAQCSTTFPCAAGQECINGVCTPPCGIPGPVSGKCVGNEDCSFCNDLNGATDVTMNDWACKYPINGGNHGNCTPPANGCSQLGGNGFAVMPPPYNQVTELCSTDNDCVQANAGIQFNVGKVIRDLAGDENGKLNLGFTKLTINDANVTYHMNKCASISLTDTIDCGVCVPCKQDSDCVPIDIDQLIVDIFKNEPLAAIAGALLIDLLYGDNPDHDINFFCQPVAFGYGACIPCGNPLQPCGGGGNGGGSGSCDHDAFTVGSALDPNCNSCAATVCPNDPFCCDGQNGSWDNLCVSQAQQSCSASCDVCVTQNGPLSTTTCNDSCVTAVCNADPYCCNNQWDSVCVGEASDNTHSACFSKTCNSN